MNRPRQAVILAGGRGRRLGRLTSTQPKAMVRFHGRPFLEYLLTMLREQGFTEALLLLGWRAEAVREHFGDGSQFGIRVRYAVEPVDIESGERLRRAGGLLDDTFLLLYCDNYWPMRFLRMWQSYADGGRVAQMTVYANTDGWSRANVTVQAGAVTGYDRERRQAGLTGVDIGYLIAQRAIVDQLPAGNVGMETLYPALARRNQLGAYLSSHRYYGIGTAERLTLAERFLERRKTVILDRDGVLNRKPAAGDYVRSWRDWEWVEGSPQALAMLHEAGYRVLIVSNQAGVARGALAPKTLAEIDRRMKQEARLAGGLVEASYYCPHGWDEGCACRKPVPGLLYQAQRDFHLDLTRTVFIGDDERDAQAAEAAGCLYAAVTPARTLAQVVEEMLEREAITGENRLCVY
jgi:D-glycero-D-manno-heptose 1,7-bisphosphate phosphatase